MAAIQIPRTAAQVGAQPVDAALTAIAALADPNADRVLFWDDSAGSYAYLAIGTGLAITGTTIDATGGGGGSSSASDLTSGTLDDARLSANVVLEGQANTFTGGPQRFSGPVGEATTGTDRVDIGVAGTPRIVMEMSGYPIYQVDNYQGTLRFIRAGTVISQFGDNGASLNNIGLNDATYGTIARIHAATGAGSVGGILIRAAAGQTADLIQVRDDADTPIAGIGPKGSFRPPSLADGDAPNNAIYYSTTASKLCYKDSVGGVNPLY